MYSHCLSDFVEDFCRSLTGFLSTCFEDRVDISRVGEDGFSPFTDGGEVVPIGFPKAFFEVSIAESPRLEVIHHGVVIRRRGEELVELQDNGIFRWLGSFHGSGVRFDTHNEFTEFLFFSEERESIVVALAHLLSIKAGHDGGCFGNDWLGHNQGAFAEAVIDFLTKIAGDFEVLFLVFSDRDEIGFIQEDVRSHEYRVGK